MLGPVSALHPAHPARRLTHDERKERTQHLFDLAAETDDAQARRHALDEVVRINARVARAVANRFAGRGVDVEDLEQTACEALVKAAHRFDRDQGRDFLAFAVPTVRGEVQRYFRDKSWTIRPRRTIQEMQGRLNRYVGEFVATHDREPTDDEACAALGIDRALYVETVTAFGCFQPISLNRPLGVVDGTAELGDVLADSRDELAPIEAAAILRPLLDRLAERDRHVVRMHFFEDRSQRDIGTRLGIKQSQVSKVLHRVLADLREQIGDLDGRAAAV